MLRGTTSRLAGSSSHNLNTTAALRGSRTIQKESEMTQTDDQRLNPQINIATIGVRELREISIYPLSMADQLEVTDLVAAAIKGYVEAGDQSELGVATFVAEAIKKNVSLLLKKATDEGEEVLAEITNMQATEIAEIIYEVNYESILGKVRSLVEKIQSQFQSPTLSPLPSDSMDSTTSPISTDEATETEDSP